MKVLLVIGSPHRRGCTFTALSETANALNQEGIETDYYWIGNKPIGGCIGCHMSIHHYPHPEKSLAEMYRILMNNGTVVINELTAT